MANFINYRNLDFTLNNQNFYAAQISLSAQASVEPIILSNGALLDYAPEGALVGSLSCDFYLTGSLPSFLNITGIDESSITANFAGVSIEQVYPKSLSFSVEYFQPILLSAEFDWYGSVKVEKFREQSPRARIAKAKPQYVASAYKTYLDTQNIFSPSSSGTSGSSGSAAYLGDKIGNILSFDYNISCDRPSFYIAGQLTPFRVAKLNKRCELSLKSNNLGKLISINGKRAATTIYLKDFYGTALSTFSISGVLNNQNYEISDGQYMLASASIEQAVTEQKVLV